MKSVLSFVLLATLAACGADGAPEPPASMSANEPGVRLSGCVTVGVTMGAPTGGEPVRC